MGKNLKFPTKEDTLPAIQDRGYGFYGHQPKTLTLSEPTYIKVGSQADSGFRAVAVALIDALYSSLSLDETLINTLLEAYFQYYPNLCPKQSLMTPQSRLKEVIRSIEISDAVSTLAHVLRQMAVDVLQDNPGKYVQAFIHGKTVVSPREMRQPGTWVEPTVIAALAYALQLPIALSMVEDGKELPLLLIFEAQAEGVKRPVLYLSVNDYQYKSLATPERFSHLHPETRHYPVPLSETSTLTLNQIQAMISQFEQRMLATYDEARKILLSAAHAGELDKADFIGIYIQTIPPTDDRTNVPLVAGLENGSQAYFSDLLHRHGRVSVDTAGKSNQDSQVCAALIDATARAVATGCLSSEDLSDLMEKSGRPTIQI